MKQEEYFYEIVKNWYEGQQGICACLGDCEVCHFHQCNGCICGLKSSIDELYGVK